MYMYILLSKLIYKLKYHSQIYFLEEIPFIQFMQILKSTRESIVLEINVAFRQLRQQLAQLGRNLSTFYSFAWVAMAQERTMIE